MTNSQQDSKNTQIIVAIIGAVAVIIAAILGGPIIDKILQRLDNPTPENTRATSCLYQGNTDLETFTNIIKAEEKAVLAEDISVIKNIYAQDAVMRDAETNEEWKNVIEKYQLLFKEGDFREHEHFEFDLIDNTGKRAWVMNAVKGVRIFAESKEVQEYESDSHSDHWIFDKNSSGCWVITNLTFNASNEPFPP